MAVLFKAGRRGRDPTDWAHIRFKDSTSVLSINVISSRDAEDVTRVPSARVGPYGSSVG